MSVIGEDRDLIVLPPQPRSQLTVQEGFFVLILDFQHHYEAIQEFLTYQLPMFDWSSNIFPLYLNLRSKKVELSNVDIIKKRKLV